MKNPFLHGRSGGRSLQWCDSERCGPPRTAHPEGAHTEGGHREDAHTDVVPLICGSVSGVLLAGLLLASGLERISLGVPQLLGTGEAHEPVAERAIAP